MPLCRARHNDSPFNGNLAEGKSRSHRGDVRNLLRGIAGKDAFPAGELVGAGRSVQDAIDAFLSREREP